MTELDRPIALLLGLGAAWLALEGWAWARAGRERALSPREWAPLLGLLALVFVLMQLGGRAVGEGLYAWLHPLFPPLRALRITLRIGFAAMLLLGLLAAFGPGLNELPDATYGMWTVLHGRRLVNGSSGFAPPFTEAIREAAVALPDAEAVARIRSVYPLRYVLAHLDQLRNDERRLWEGFRRMPPDGLRVVGRFGPTLVLGIASAGPGVTLRSTWWRPAPASPTAGRRGSGSTPRTPPRTSAATTWSSWIRAARSAAATCSTPAARRPRARGWPGSSAGSRPARSWWPRSRTRGSASSQTTRWRSFRSVGGRLDPRAGGLFVSHVLIGVKGAPPGAAVEALGTERLVGQDRGDRQLVIEDFRLD